MSEKFVKAINLQKEWALWKTIAPAGKNLVFKAHGDLQPSFLRIEVSLSGYPTLPLSIADSIVQGLNDATQQITNKVELAFKAKVQAAKNEGKAEAQEVIDSLSG